MGLADDIKRLLFARSALLQQRKEVTAAIDRDLEEIEKALLNLRDGGAASWEGETITVASPDVEIPPTGRFGKSLMVAIVRDGTLDYASLSTEIFGADCPANRQKIHNGLDHLRKKGFITRLSRNTWALRKQKRRGRPRKNP